MCNKVHWSYCVDTWEAILKSTSFNTGLGKKKFKIIKWCKIVKAGKIKSTVSMLLYSVWVSVFLCLSFSQLRMKRRQREFCSHMATEPMSPRRPNDDLNKGTALETLLQFRDRIQKTLHNLLTRSYNYRPLRGQCKLILYPSILFYHHLSYTQDCRGTGNYSGLHRGEGN